MPALPPTRQGTASAVVTWLSKVGDPYLCFSTLNCLALFNSPLPLPSTKVNLNLSSASCSFIPEPPYFVEKPQSQDVNPSTRVQLKALVGGTAPMTIKWFKDNKELHPGAARSVWKDDTSTILELFSAKAADSGTYICQLSNDVGTASSKATIFVKGLLPLAPLFLACLACLWEGEICEENSFVHWALF